MSEETVIPAYPYEGAFYWFLASGQAHSQDHPYYRVLYGDDPVRLGSRAAALTSLYPNILLGAADTLLPDYRQFLSGQQYHHPDLRISLNYDDNEWAAETQETAKAAGNDPDIDSVLAGKRTLISDRELRHHFLCRTVLQIRLAARTGGTLLGDEFFQRVYAVVAPWVAELGTGSTEPLGIAKLAFGRSALAITGLDFAPPSLEAFAAIRASKDIADYADSFRDALRDAQEHENLEGRLVELMTQAMDSEDIAKKASGAFQTTGSIMNVLGFVPIVSSVTSAIGLGTDAGGRLATSKAARASWYLLGAKLHEVAIRDVLKRRRGG